MVDILHHVGVEAQLSRTYEAIATRMGLSGWWTEDVTGDERPNGVLVFRFGGDVADGRVVGRGGAGRPPAYVHLNLPSRVRLCALPSTVAPQVSLP